ncbi:MAG: FAD-binding protein [Candidatus Hydrogenedentes bacterium]|nr:FAD-binding protein [Candidatus Hydrogenedentota bacterium]
MSKHYWSNWSGSVQCAPGRYVLPRSIDEVATVIREAAREGKTVRPVGSGHSFTDLAKTNDVMISLDHLKGLMEVDTRTREAHAWAGTKLWKLNDVLERYGLSMENLGDINRQSVGGAIGTGTHGTGLNFGSLSTQVISLTLVTASGEVLECSAEREPEVFKAALVSLGTLGVITDVRLRLLPAYRLSYVRKKGDFEETLEKADAYAHANRNFEFYLFPHTDTVQLKFLNETEAAPMRHAMRKWYTDTLLENTAFGVISRRCRSKPTRCPAMSKLAARHLTECEEIDSGHRLLSTKRSVKFNEMEYALPVENGVKAMRELKAWIEKEGIAVNFPIEFRYVKGDDIPLSPCYGRDSVCISLHMFQGMPYQDYFDGGERILRRYDGRPHWGKLHSLKAKELAKLYPEWDKFRAVRKRLDPKGVFLNSYLKALLGA